MDSSRPEAVGAVLRPKSLLGGCLALQVSPESMQQLIAGLA